MSLAERYLELGLRLGRLGDGLVDDYFGPDELARRVEAEAPAEPAALAADAEALLEDVRSRTDWPDSRRRRLEGQLRGVAVTARRLAGATLSYAEEVELTYGVAPRWHAEDELERAHRLLDEALPGDGDVGARYRRWLATAIPPEALPRALEAVAAELRARTQELVGLPDGERIEVELVRDRHWLGYARYLGGFRSRISVNLDLPFPAGDLAHFVAHEVYPGHHAYRCWHDAALVRERGLREETIGLLCSPDAILAEGSADLASELVGGAEAHEAVARELGRLGLDYDAAAGARVGTARLALKGVTSNVALMLHGRGASREEARDYARRWSLQSEERVEKLVRGVEDRTLRGYVVSYTEGLRLCRDFVRGDPGRFRRLLTEQLVPADLAAPAG